MKEGRSVMISLMVCCVLACGVQCIWFKAYSQKSNMPFCFVDQMTDEKDYVLKWFVEQPANYLEDDKIEIAKEHGKKEQKNKGKAEVEDDSLKKKVNILYFNITSFLTVEDSESDTTSRKIVGHSFLTTEKSLNKSEGQLVFSVEDSTSI